MTFDVDPWMKQALLLAEAAAAEGEVPVGALVLLEGQVIGRGYNQREGKNDAFSHAEIIAIQEASRYLKSWRLTSCILISTLEPCPMCLAGCQQARLKEVFYGARDPKGGALSLGYRLHEDQRTNHRFPVTHSNHPACGQILSDFFAKRRRLVRNS